MGLGKENPLPDHTDKEELANQFARFFITKIQKIRDLLDNLPTYCHISMDPPEFLEFKLMMEEEVGNIIKGMPAKMCDMDIIPTTLLKDALPGFAAHNNQDSKCFHDTRNVYVSLENCSCQTLIKKIGP